MNKNVSIGWNGYDLSSTFFFTCCCLWYSWFIYLIHMCVGFYIYHKQYYNIVKHKLLWLQLQLFDILLILLYFLNWFMPLLIWYVEIKLCWYLIVLFCSPFLLCKCVFCFSLLFLFFFFCLFVDFWHLVTLAAFLFCLFYYY